MRLSTGVCAVALLGLSAVAAIADPVSITFTPNTFTIAPGDPTFTISGTVTNNTADPIFLGGDMLNLVPDDPGISIDDTPLFLAAPPFGTPFLNAGETYTGDFFDVTVDSSVFGGNYLGSLTLVGGTGPTGAPTDTAFLGSQSFRLNVTPEPSALAMAGAAGLTGVAFVLRRRPGRRSRTANR